MEPGHNQESQTQDDTQCDTRPPLKASELKRRSGSSGEVARYGKKTRISVVEEDVDIEE